MRVGIVGAGPSGSYCALRLLGLAREAGRELQVSLYDPKPFDRAGRSGCNLCAGLLTTPVLERLARLGVQLEEGILQRPIRGFLLVAAGGAERFYAPPGHLLHSVFRGGGPLRADSAPAASFDHLLVRHAAAAGAVFLPRQVVQIRRATAAGGPAWILGDSSGEEEEVDFLVGAFGVNSASASLFEALGTGYRRPATETAIQVEFPLEEEFIDRIYRNQVVIFDLGIRQARLAALVPKKAFITLTLIGDGPGWPTVTWLLRQPEVQQWLPGAASGRRHACVCRPVLPVRPARGAAADRLLVIGDAHVSRYYKNGIGSAFRTAEQAAQAILRGTDRRLLRRHYLLPCRRRFYRDNVYGRVLFRLNDRIARSPFHSAVQLECASRTSRRGGRILHLALWGMFTGETSYRRILLQVLHPLSVAEMALGYGRRLLPLPRRPTALLGPLAEGGRVAIIGGGVAGSTAALALLREAERRGVTLRVLLVEPKSFGTQYNQCLGVLTPPVLEILRQELGVELREGMIRREVSGYRLHAGGRAVDLPEAPEEGRTVAIRRVELDRLLLDLAEERGVRVIAARVTAVEVHPEEVILFTDSGTYAASVVVGAFGLDDSMQEAFTRSVGYLPPRALETVVIKLHPTDPRVVDRFGGRIESFLVPLPGTSFAAIVPKGDHLSVVVAGAQVTTRHLLQFLELPGVRRILSFEYQLGPAFRGSFPNGRAHRFFGDRFALIGDAAGLVRPFKGKGINSAVITGLRVAEAIVGEGISREAFAGYARRCEELAGHVPSGRAVQFLSLFLGRTAGLGPLVAYAETNPDFREALYGAVSGRRDYREVLRASLRPRVLFGLAAAYLGRPAGKPARVG